MAAPKLVGYVHVAGTVYGPGDKVPAKHAALITNPKAWEGGKAPKTAAASPEDSADAEENGEDEGEKGYDDLTVDELKTEIDSRNADREDDAKLSKTGNKADLVAALEADDEAAADS